jgi:magnesium-transporting ATPase (P-type)
MASSKLSLCCLDWSHSTIHRGKRPRAIAEAHAAGLRVEMLTGDHPLTAHAIGRSLGLPAEAVHARVTFEEKLRLVERRQAEGETVAVTGDGVNDAPALRRADVGVAMGRGGTEAAREASDLVLTNDDFATIVAAIREGRAITDNIRKFVAFLVSANFGEVILFGIAILAGLGAPMTVVQVLLVNVLTDGLPAVALARDPASPMTMKRPTGAPNSFRASIGPPLGSSEPLSASPDLPLSSSVRAGMRRRPGHSPRSLSPSSYSSSRCGRGSSMPGVSRPTLTSLLG